jgi:AAA+ ATPase superfamily predicted ATPase
MAFYGRQRELLTLDNLYKRPGGQLFVLYGRRRVGKTVLLNHWLTTRGHRSIFWTADRTNASTLLRLFSRAVQSFIEPNQAIPDDFTYATWELALTKAHHILGALIPPKLYYRLHINLIQQESINYWRWLCSSPRTRQP